MLLQLDQSGFRRSARGPQQPRPRRQGPEEVHRRRQEREALHRHRAGGHALAHRAPSAFQERYFWSHSCFMLFTCDPPLLHQTQAHSTCGKRCRRLSCHLLSSAHTTSTQWAGTWMLCSVHCDLLVAGRLLPETLLLCPYFNYMPFSSILTFLPFRVV